MPQQQYKARIKVRPTISRRTEWVLQHECGFTRYSTNPQWIIFAKPLDWKKEEATHHKSLDDSNSISDERQTEINKRCTKIYDIYIDPFACKKQIKEQLERYARQLSPIEQEYVKNWIYNYVL